MSRGKLFERPAVYKWLDGDLWLICEQFDSASPPQDTSILACSYRYIDIELFLITEIRYHWMFVPVQDRKLSLTGTLSQTRRLEDLTLEQDITT